MKRGFPLSILGASSKDRPLDLRLSQLGVVDAVAETSQVEAPEADLAGRFGHPGSHSTSVLPWRRLEGLLAVLRARWYLRDATLLGHRVRLFGRPMVSNEGILIIGDRVNLLSTVMTMELTVSPAAQLEIGAYTFINYGSIISASRLIRIGSGCQIGPQTVILDNNFHRLEPERRNEASEPAAVILEDNVWLGVRTTILPGVTIGAGSVIGAGSIVTHDIPPRSLAVGVPARVIRSL